MARQVSSSSQLTTTHSKINRVKAQLTNVRMRQQFSRGFQWATVGLLGAAVLGCIALLLQRVGVIPIDATPWLLLLFGGLGALSLGLVWPTSWKSTAVLVDKHYGLKDRMLTALDFARRDLGGVSNDPLHQMQMADALKHLDSVEPTDVLPYRAPRFALATVSAIVLMIGITLSPSTDATPVAEVSQASPVVLEQAAVLEDTMLDDMQELAEEYHEEDLQELVKELEEAVEELRQPEVDQREALAKLSEMQQAVAEKMEQLNVEQIDAQLEQLAQALEATEATEAASQALKSQNYEQAAGELEKIDASTMSRREKDAVKQNLAKLAKNLGNAQKGELSDAVSQMIDGLEKGSDSECKGGMCKAAGVCKKQSVRKKISECLNCQLNRLSECKGCCQGGKNGGNCVTKSDSPSTKWGRGASNNPTGEKKTKIDSTRRDESVTGIAGDGPSERETTSSPDARQNAARSYRDRYADFKKQMEDVIDSEPLPLGHRQTVRAYFESIRPSSSEMVD